MRSGVEPARPEAGVAGGVPAVGGVPARARLCFVSYRHLSALAQRLIADYAEVADIEAVDAAFDSAIAVARARERARMVDVFVSAGSNAALLKTAVSAPVATIKIDGYDMLLALQRARRHADTVGIVSFGEPVAELEAVKSLLQMQVVQYAYRTENEVRRSLLDLRRQGCQVVVGSSIVVEAAGQMGLHGILAYSERSIRQGIEDAIEMARAASREVARYLRRQRQERRQFAVRHTFDDLAGNSPVFVQAREAARHYAQADATVLLTGETGTGKEWFAQAIHHASRRRSRPFVAINCAALPETLLEGELFGHEDGAFTGARRGGRPGVFEAANTGSLFLDEIGDMPLPLQTRLLRVLQEREVTRLGSARPIPLDIRILAATHQPLAQLVAQGRFRADLYYRLNVLALTLPPLRDRREDLPPIAVRQLAQALRRLGSELEAHALLAPFLSAMLRHDWPGNLRELENMAERLAARACRWGDLGSVDFGELWHALPELVGGAGAPTPAADWRAVLQSCGNNRSEAARRLGVSRSTLWRWLRATPSGPDPG